MVEGEETGEYEEIAADLFSDAIIEPVRERMYILTKNKEKQLTSGFRQIKQMIYNVMSMILFKQCRVLLDNRIPVIGVHTDCLYVMAEFEDVEDIFTWHNMPTGQKWEEEKLPIMKQLKLEMFEEEAEIDI